MIQRMQTVYLSLALVASVLLFFFPLANYISTEVFATGTEQIYKLYITGLKSMIPGTTAPAGPWFTWPLTAITIVSGILIIITIAMFRNRLLQMRMAAVNILLNIGQIALIYLYYISKVENLAGITPNYRFGIFLPLAILALLILAYYAIRKDEATVRAADRLR